MTENEAIIQLNFDMEMIRFNPDTGENLTLEQIKAHNEDNYKTYLADELAITALTEIQQYRAIGTVEQLEWCKDASHWKELFKEKLEQYESIGTIEEFKDLKKQDHDCTIKHLSGECSYKETGCSDCKSKWKIKDLLEKNEPKKPLFSTVHGDSAYHCSSCKKFVGFYDTRIYEYCHNCGQLLDWSEWREQI